MVGQEMIRNLIEEYAVLLERRKAYIREIKANEEIINDRRTFYYDAIECRTENRNYKSGLNEVDNRLNEIAIFFKENNINLEMYLSNRNR